ncbi:hypothetical protein Lupro_03325 [Lutibacter profundi]|uniref:Uncharacterized protein n=1 Tax=Lutibacter profundi TaxID=1622118 RepID=A0A0X8G5C2_9FLAO|nr:DUF6452 family protein [Lutibacter profundi]AMC10341.1 hypothetical protein Lupro_03325 [Lutibacter profundi]
MKKNYVLIFIFLFTFLSCEKDDICVETTTPNLIIKFYDNDDPTVIKQVTELTVWAETKDSIYINKSLDSIIIPLNLNENFTKYILENNTIKDTVKFTYNRNDIFVSRSCGYKTIFENLQIESNTTNWIKSISINNSTIDNEKATHIYIFH